MFSQLSRFIGSVRLRVLAGATCLAVSGAAGVLVAGDPLPPAAPVTPAAKALPARPPEAAKSVAISDVTLARAALAALDADTLLKDVNIVVSVVDRSAVIGGPVATEELRKRVEEVIRGVPGIGSVKNTCFVQADPDPLLRAVAERLKPGAKPADQAALPGVALSPAAPEGFLPPLPPQPPSDLLASAGSPKTVVAQKPPLSIGPSVAVLGAPVSPASTGSGAVTPAPSVAPGELTGSAGPAKPVDLRSAVAALRKADARFARLAVERKPDGGLFVTGWCAKASDAWAFAAELRKLPGVQHVAVDPSLVK